MRDEGYIEDQRGEFAEYEDYAALLARAERAEKLLGEATEILREIREVEPHTTRCDRNSDRPMGCDCEMGPLCDQIDAHLAASRGRG